MILYFFLEAPHRWAIVDRKNRVLEDGLAESLDHIPIRHRRITRRVAVVPGELVTIHSLRIPAKSRGKAIAAVPYMLEESLAGNVDDLEFRLLRWVRGGVSKVAVLSREQMAHWREKLLEFPERTDALLPEYLLLPRHAQGRCTIAADHDGRLVIRTGDLDGLVINDQELDLWWQEMANTDLPVAINDADHARYLIQCGGTMVSEWDIGTHFPDWLRHGHQVPENTNLLQHGVAGSEAAASRPWLKAAATMLALALIVRVGVDGYAYFILATEEDRLDSAIEATLKQAFPDITRVVQPRAQMEQRLTALKGQSLSGGFLVLLSVVAEAVPVSRATVEEITFRDTTLLVTCSTTDFEALDQLQQRLSEEDRITVELVSSGSRENRVSGRFRLNLKTG